ncbi:hypothetical protein MASR1M32_09170 [Rhodobacter sp.]
MPPIYPLIAIAAAALLLWLTWRLAQAQRQRRLTRAGYFDALRPLFDSVRGKIEPSGFPRVSARRGEHGFDLQAVTDTLTFRKLPALWVMVSLPEPLPLAATLDIMARPSGQEPFTHFTTLPQMLPAPEGTPEGLALRSDNATGLPSESLIARHSQIFADKKVKELLISPKGLRLVILAEEADRGRYLIFRDAEMGIVPISPARIAPLLDSLLALREDLLDWTKGKP